MRPGAGLEPKRVSPGEDQGLGVFGVHGLFLLRVGATYRPRAATQDECSQEHLLAVHYVMCPPPNRPWQVTIFRHGGVPSSKQPPKLDPFRRPWHLQLATL